MAALTHDHRRLASSTELFKPSVYFHSKDGLVLKYIQSNVTKAAVAYFKMQYRKSSVPVATRTKAWVRGPSLVGRAGSNPARGMDICLVRVLCVVR